MIIDFSCDDEFFLNECDHVIASCDYCGKCKALPYLGSGPSEACLDTFLGVLTANKWLWDYITRTQLGWYEEVIRHYCSVECYWEDQGE